MAVKILTYEVVGLGRRVTIVAQVLTNIVMAQEVYKTTISKWLTFTILKMHPYD